MLMLEQFFGTEFSNLEDARPGSAWLIIFVSTVTVIVSTSFVLLDAKSALRRVWRVWRGRIVGAIPFADSLMSRRHSQGNDLGNEELEVQSASSTLKQGKRSAEDEVLPGGLRKHWFDRHNLRPRYISWCFLLMLLLSVFLGFVQLLISVIQFYYSPGT